MVALHCGTQWHDALVRLTSFKPCEFRKYKLSICDLWVFVDELDCRRRKKWVTSKTWHSPLQRPHQHLQLQSLFTVSRSIIICGIKFRPHSVWGIPNDAMPVCNVIVFMANFVTEHKAIFEATIIGTPPTHCWFCNCVISNAAHIAEIVNVTP